MPEPIRPDDPFNALTDDDVRVAGASEGPLSPLRFVVKDLYDIAGYKTVAGSPAWEQAHDAATNTAPAVASLLEAGANLVGKSHTDELAWSLLGQNAHYGTPTNPRNRDRIPGGSSSGSVVAVAGEMVDFSIGSDTGGSVRVPASNCGVYGIRTTHGAISLEHVVALAPSFDTVGWFANDAETLAKVGAALLPQAPTSSRLSRGLVARDAFALVDAPVRAVLEATIESLDSTLEPRAEASLSSGGLDSWASAWRTIQAREVWGVHGSWVEKESPSFGPGIRERFEWARTVSDSDEAAARRLQQRARDELAATLTDGTVAIVPAVASVAPKLDESAEALERYRTRTMMLTCVAGLCGLPQITVPAGDVDGCPVGLGLIGPPGSDLALLELAMRMARA